MRPFFKDDDFSFLTEIALGSVYHRAADVGEVLSTVERIRDGKPQSWVDEWTATAARVAAEADTTVSAGHTRSAAQQFLRASSYYSMASYSADGTGDPALFAVLWEKHRGMWDRWVDLTTVDVERIEVPYEGTTLPGYFFRAPPGDVARRTLIFNNGSDGSVTGAWFEGIADAIARGWNAMTFDGPGQNAALVRQGLGFRPDWERVVTPVVDYLSSRPDVDPQKLALLGVSQAGYWVPRAVAFEHRIAAAVADPGVIDVSTTILSHLSRHLLKMLDEGDQEQFDKQFALGLRFMKPMRAVMAFRMRPYRTDSPYEFFAAARDYRLTDEMIAEIRCPVLVTDPENEQFWPGQPQELYEKLSGDKTIIHFTEEEGADSHCEPAGNAIRGERIFDWLTERIPD